MDFAIDHRLEGDIAIVEVSGWIEISSAPQLRDTLISLIDEGHLRLVLDLSSTVFLDSTGLGVLVGRLKLARTRGGSMRLVGTDDRVLKVFAITGLDKVFEIHPDVDAALAAGVTPAETS
jgi:anti-sigma B factor antagonist